MNHQILDILRNEGRASNAEIAQRLDLSEQDVADEIARLTKNKTVLGYHAIVNPEKLEDEWTVGIIEVKITPQRNVGYDEIAAQIYRFPEVKLCYLISGAYDVLVFVEGKNLKEVATFVARKLATIDNVTSTATHFILKKYKEDGFIMNDETEDKRLPIVP
jgi:DNA-binding Lrp family transcriptional regulator